MSLLLLQTQLAFEPYLRMMFYDSVSGLPTYFVVNGETIELLGDEPIQMEYLITDMLEETLEQEENL
jgi:hypothetical protein